MPRPTETTPMSLREISARTVVWLGVAGSFAFVYLNRYALCALFGGAVIGIAVKPIVERLARFGWSQRVASGIVFGTILCAVGAASIWLVPLVGAQLASLGQRLPELIGELSGRLAHSSFSVVRSIGGLASPFLQSRGADHDPILVQAAGFLGGALRGGYLALLIVIMAAAWNDAVTATRPLLLRIIPAQQREPVSGFLEEAEAKLGAYVRGQLIVCALSSTVGTIACFALGLPYALLLGLTAGACEVIPLVGPMFAGAVVLLIALVTVPSHAPLIALIFLLNHLTQSYLVTPRVMDRAVGVTPLAVLSSVVVFGALLGVPGGVLAIPFAAVLQVALDRFVFHPDLSPARAVAR